MKVKRVALVTGGASGIGLATARTLARDGYSVAVLDKAPTDRDALASELRALGSSAALVQRFDLSDAASHADVVSAVEAELGGIDVLVNNAGIPARTRGDLLAVEPESFDAVLQVNLRGTFFLTQAVAKRMVARETREADRRSIITISSVSAVMASVERGEYCLSKAALPMLVQLFATRLASHGIGVFEVRPGIIHTAMTEKVSARYDEAIAGGLVPCGRWGEPQDVAEAVRLLASGAVNFATGSVLAADGGLSIARL